MRTAHLCAGMSRISPIVTAASSPRLLPMTPRIPLLDVIIAIPAPSLALRCPLLAAPLPPSVALSLTSAAARARVDLEEAVVTLAPLAAPLSIALVAGHPALYLYPLSPPTIAPLSPPAWEAAASTAHDWLAQCARHILAAKILAVLGGPVAPQRLPQCWRWIGMARFLFIAGRQDQRSNICPRFCGLSALSLAACKQCACPRWRCLRRWRPCRLPLGGGHGLEEHCWALYRRGWRPCWRRPRRRPRGQHR
mmetsp:Transcript_63188/g.135687  ORF Transcript_63188/g.135687 Transcript_63188/m.135687 type:complete len:251 (-) Transcript_63188:131-883(-)